MSEKKKNLPDGMGLFCGKDKPDPQSGWKLYQRGLEYNSSINLDDTVQANENFYIGKQWEGVIANGQPTPQFNMFKRDVGFIIATTTSDNIKVNASALAAAPNSQELAEPARIVTEEFAAISERLDVPSLVRDFARDAAVDGDGCMYTYWDADIETGQKAKGAIMTELVENTRVFFGNPNDRRVQTQPWIIISKREIVRNVKLSARGNDIETWEQISADTDDNLAVDAAKRTDDKVTVLLLMWRDDRDKKIWAYEFTQQSAVKEPWSLDIRLYPIVWFNWDFVRDCYHGQAMLTGLIPNQIFVNKMWAMSMISMMGSAFPKIVYNKTLVQRWDNRAGAAIGISGGDINNVAKAIDPAPLSPQVGQFIQLAVDMTGQMLGATNVALGNTRPDNTSAIIALQRAAQTPTELTKQNLYKCVEDLFRIYLEFMVANYGTRTVNIETPPKVRQAAAMAGQKVGDMIPTPFDFKTLKDHPMQLKLDIGASSYYSEIASQQTLDNLLMNKHINAVQYLERLPEWQIPNRRGLISELKDAQMQAQAAQMQQMAQQAAPVPREANIAPPEQTEVKGGGGYSTLQRQINKTGDTAGLL